MYRFNKKTAWLMLNKVRNISILEILVYQSTVAVSVSVKKDLETESVETE